MHLQCNPFWQPCWCSGVIQLKLPNRGGPGLHLKPLDAIIGRVLTLYCPGGQGGWFKNNWLKKHHTCWPFRWPWQYTGTILHTSLPNEGGAGLHWKPLITITGLVWWPIYEIGHPYSGYLQVFSSLACWNGVHGDIKAHNNNRSMTNKSNGRS